MSNSLVRYEESAPLLVGPSASREFDELESETQEFRARLHNQQLAFHHSSDESDLFDLIMEKVNGSRFAHLAKKLEVESESGLTNAQSMLNNFDLKPGKIAEN